MDKTLSFGLFYTYFDTPPQLFHQIQKMTILLSYTLRKWKDSENSEKCKGGCQNTSKRLDDAAKGDKTSEGGVQTRDIEFYEDLVQKIEKN